MALCVHASKSLPLSSPELSDLNFLTIHGRSRFPGLYIWLRDGRRAAVKVPEQCLLVQAGKQFEYISGGYVLAGFHEVVVAPSTQRAIEAAKAEGRSCWCVPVAPQRCG